MSLTTGTTTILRTVIAENGGAIDATLIAARKYQSPAYHILCKALDSYRGKPTEFFVSPSGCVRVR